MLRVSADNETSGCTRCPWILCTITFGSQLTVAIVAAMTPTIAVLIGVILQRQDTRDLRTDLNRQMGDLRNDLGGQVVDLRNQVHADLLLIHERVAKVEAGKDSDGIIVPVRAVVQRRVVRRRAGTQIPREGQPSAAAVILGRAKTSEVRL